MRHLINIVESVLNELNVIDDLDDETIQNQMDTVHADAAKQSRTVGRLPAGFQVLSQRKDDHSVYYVTTARGQLVGRAVVEKFGEFYRERHVWFRPEFRKKGLGLQLYRFLLDDEGLTLVSDWAQTMGAKALWTKLAQEGRVHVYTRGEGIGKQVTDLAPYYSDVGSFSVGMLVAVPR